MISVTCSPYCSSGHTGPAVAGSLGIEAVLRMRQESHVKQFLQTEGAFQAGSAAQQQLQEMKTELDRSAPANHLSTYSTAYLG